MKSRFGALAALAFIVSASAQAEELVNQVLLSQDAGVWRRGSETLTISRSQAGQPIRVSVAVPFVQTSIYHNTYLVLPATTDVNGNRVPPVYAERDEPTEKVLTANTRTVRVTVNNPALQSFEVETFVVSAGNTTGDSNVTPSNPYTIYSARQNGSDSFQFDGSGRNLSNVAPPSVEELKSWYGVKSTGPGQAELDINIKPQYFNPESGTVSVLVSYQAQTTDGVFSSWKNVDSREVTVTSQDGTKIQIGNIGPKAKSVRVQFKISLRGSSLYDGRFTAASEWKEVKLNK